MRERERERVYNSIFMEKRMEKNEKIGCERKVKLQLRHLYPQEMVVMTSRRNGVPKTMRIVQRRNQNQSGGKWKM